MKKLLGITLSLAGLLMLVSCGGEEAIEMPSVTYTVTDNGGTLALDWDDITDAEGYYIYADGVLIDSTTDSEYDATEPAQVYGVSAYNADDESATDDVDCAPEVTANVIVYGASDPDTAHPSGLSFTTSGTAVALAIGVTANHPDLDYIFDDRAPFTTMTLVSPNAYTPVYNDEKNMGVDAQATDFDAVIIANAPGVYSTQTSLQGNAVYALFMDQDDDGWDTDSDHFGKMKVESIAGTTVTITVAYQTITGLRWLVT